MPNMAKDKSLHYIVFSGRLEYSVYNIASIMRKVLENGKKSSSWPQRLQENN